MRALILVLAGVVASISGCGPTSHQKDFASAEEAARALVGAARAGDVSTLVELLGPEAEPMVDSGDPVQDRNARVRFVHSFDAHHSFLKGEEGMQTLQVGEDKWPFPYPLVENEGRWHFDSTAGVQEIINRRIGANELSTIQSCLAFVDAQREYYVRNPERDRLMTYAKLLVSSPGKKDGLYWPTAANEPQSPLGERFAQARSEGYFSEGPARGQPFRGYIYRLLTAQGPNAPGGAYDYLVGDKLFGGFALIAFPADYGSSGVMTFIVNHDGVVYSKDLGSETSKAALAVESFDPDPTWKREAAIEVRMRTSDVPAGGRAVK
jgi:hypothetical protein